MTENFKKCPQIETKSNITSANSDIQIHFLNTSKKLAEGILTTYKRPLFYVNQEVIDLTTKQELCITKIGLENKKLCNLQEHLELHNLFTTIEAYNKKVLKIKCDIMAVHERIFQLKKKMLRFRQSSKPNEVLLKD